MSERSRRCYAHDFPCGYLSFDGSHMLGDQSQHNSKKEVKGSREFSDHEVDVQNISIIQSHQIHFGSGHWIHRNQTEEEVEWDLRYQHCAINIIGHRHACPTEKVFRTRQWHWEGSSGFPSLVRPPDNSSSSSSSHLLNSRLNGKLIAFWGDSLTLQFYVGFVCSFYAAGAMVEKEKDAPSKIEISRIYWISNRGPVITLRAASVICPFLLLNKAGGHTFDPAYDTVCAEMVQLLNHTHQVTHLVANSGFWYRGNATSFGITSALRALERFYLTHPTMPPPHFFWRGLTSKHYFEVNWHIANQSGCDRFLKPSFELHPSRFQDYVWVKERNELTLGILANVSEDGVFKRMDYLDVQHFDQFRGDAHMGGRDCTHYCGPAVPSLWVQWLLQILFPTL